MSKRNPFKGDLLSEKYEALRKDQSVRLYVEYWNGLDNHMVMLDALDEITKCAKEALERMSTIKEALERMSTIPADCATALADRVREAVREEAEWWFKNAYHPTNHPKACHLCERLAAHRAAAEPPDMGYVGESRIPWESVEGAPKINAAAGAPEKTNG